jgi:preprotein translocase subunit Sec63
MSKEYIPKILQGKSKEHLNISIRFKIRPRKRLNVLSKVVFKNRKMFTILISLISAKRSIKEIQNIGRK